MDEDETWKSSLIGSSVEGSVWFWQVSQNSAYQRLVSFYVGTYLISEGLSCNPGQWDNKGVWNNA